MSDAAACPSPATISGSYERLIAAVANKKEDTVQVPSWDQLAASHGFFAKNTRAS